MIPSATRRFEKLFDLTGRTALITGAGSGFGRVIALGFAEYGADITAADIDCEGARETARQVTEMGRRGAAWRFRPMWAYPSR